MISWIKLSTDTSRIIDVSQYRTCIGVLHQHDTDTYVFFLIRPFQIIITGVDV
jgi:hypothetical protein